VIWLAALWLAGSASALTVGVFPASAGLDQGFGYRNCPSCATVYSLSAAAPVGAGSSITFTNGLVPIEIVSLSLVSVNPIFTSGPNSVTFSGMSYTASVPALVFPIGGGLLFVQQSGAATGTVTGSYTATLGGSGPINVTPAVHSLTCVVDAAGQGVCGVTFGPTAFPVNDGAETLTFQHTFNVNIPEPGPLALMITGLVGLGILGRRRTRAS
jgi:hypothetical protein